MSEQLPPTQLVSNAGQSALVLQLYLQTFPLPLELSTQRMRAQPQSASLQLVDPIGRSCTVSQIAGAAHVLLPPGAREFGEPCVRRRSRRRPS